MNQKLRNGLSLGAVVLVLAAQLCLAYQLLALDMVPGKYLAVAAAVVLVLDLLIFVLAFPKRGKYQKTERLTQRIIAWILALVISFGCFAGSSAVAKVRQTMHAVTQEPVISDVIGLYTLSDSGVTLENLSTVGINQSYDWENSQTAFQALTEEAAPTSQVFPHVFAMVDALYAGQIDAMLLNTAYLSLLEEIEPYTDFADRTALLWDHSIHEVPTQPTQPTQPSQTQGTVPTGEGETLAPPPPTEPEGLAPFVLYLSGSDTRSSVLTTSRSDVNILAVVNPKTKQILLVNTPRDYYIGNPAGGGALDKLTHCGIYGIDCSMEALATLYGIDVPYYGQVNFTGFETLVDAVGGVEVYSEISYTMQTKYGPHYVQRGMNYFVGYQAILFARERYAYADGDHARGRNQMRLIQAILGKMTAGTLLTKYADILDSMKGTFRTNMSMETIADYVKMQLEDMAAWNIQSYAVSGTGASEKTYSMPHLYAYVMVPDMDTVHKARDLMNRVLSGEILTKEDVKN